MVHRVGMLTCFIRYVSHVGRVMFDCSFVMFQRRFKVFILVRRIPQFLFLQGLSEKERVDMLEKKKTLREDNNQTGQMCLKIQYKYGTQTHLPVACFLEGLPLWEEGAGSLWVWVGVEERALLPSQGNLAPTAQRVWSSPSNLAVS